MLLLRFDPKAGPGDLIAIKKFLCLLERNQLYEDND